MEVIGTNSQIKESEASTSNNNYSCRQARGTQNKSEADIGLLVACKVQLSSEVIRWKTESLRLQRERDSAVQKSRALDQAISKLSDQIRELETRLVLAEDENRLLKLKGSSMRDGSLTSPLQFSQYVPKYHSFPWTSNPDKLNLPCFSRLESPSRYERQGNPEEDWRKVSQKMLEQMRQEMKELQEMSTNFKFSEDNAAESNSIEDCTDELEECVSSLLSETESLKHHLLEQRWKLNSLVEEFDSGKIEILENIEPISPPRYPTHQYRDGTESEESYRQYFSKKLGTPSDLNKMAKKMKRLLKGPELNVKPSKKQVESPTRRVSVPQPHLNVLNQEKSESVERICPICQMTFSSNVNQVEFEEHVMNHLENESASLLDQYVVL